MLSLTVNGRPREFGRTSLSLAELIEELALTGKRIAVELNGAIVPRSAYGATPLNAGDRLEIVGAVGGG